jgi:hypothetical protein
MRTPARIDAGHRTRSWGPKFTSMSIRPLSAAIRPRGGGGGAEQEAPRSAARTPPGNLHSQSRRVTKRASSLSSPAKITQELVALVPGLVGCVAICRGWGTVCGWLGFYFFLGCLGTWCMWLAASLEIRESFKRGGAHGARAMTD